MEFNNIINYLIIYDSIPERRTPPILTIHLRKKGKLISMTAFHSSIGTPINPGSPPDFATTADRLLRQS